MSIKAPVGATYEPMPAGMYPAICQMIVLIGTVPNPFAHPEKPWTATRKELFLRWEFPTETKVFREERGPEPYTIGKIYTLSMSSKASLRRDVESWQGKSLDDIEAKEFDIEALIGKPCLINVIHVQRNGQTRADIGGITPLVKGMAVPNPVGAPVVLSPDNWSDAIFRSLPQWIQDKISSSAEYNEPKQEQKEPNDDLPF